MHKDKGFKFLISSRIFRSVAVVYMSLVAQLYLNQVLHVSVLSIGFIIFGVVIFNSMLVMALGFLGDRMGYKKALLLSEVPPMAGAMLLWFATHNIFLISTAVIITGLSGVAGGLRGTFSPGLTPLIASNYKENDTRVHKMGILTTASAISSIIGAAMLVAEFYFHIYLASLYPHLSSVSIAYRLFFIVSALLILLSFISLLFVEEEKRPIKSTRLMKKVSFDYMKRVIAANTLAGVGIGLGVTLLPLWLSVAFKASNMEIGILFVLSNIATAIGAYISSRYAHRSNALSVASRTRITNGILLVLMAFTPFIGEIGFILATIFYAIRGYMAGFGSPSRSIVNIRGIHREDYGSAAGIQGSVNRFSQASSGLSGALMEFSLPLPLFVGGIIQAIGGYLYGKLLKGEE